MASKIEIKDNPKIVHCSNCGKPVHITSAKMFSGSKSSETQYFCSIECSLQKLFGITSHLHEFLAGVENGK